MKLIINADDLGFSKGINYGIYDAYKNGVVRSTTLMMNMEMTDHAIDIFKDTDMGIGVHLNITSGRPLIDSHTHIVNDKGDFKKEYDFTENELKEIEIEFEAQIQLAIKKGVQITHLDSHHHIHMWQEGMFKLTKKIAKAHHLKMRVNKQYEFMREDLYDDIKTTASFCEDFFDQTVSIENFLNIVKRSLNESSLEIMVHPGFLCGNLINRDSYREMRMVENSILTSTDVKSFMKEHNIKLINFCQL